MVIRVKSRIRKHLGARRWGMGNIKNARGKGDQGGTGLGGRKHKWTRIVKYESERIRQKGFYNTNPIRVYKESDLERVSELARHSKESKPTVELKGYKVLGDGKIEKAIVVKASSFSKQAEEKIKKAGGEAIRV